MANSEKNKSEPNHEAEEKVEAVVDPDTAEPSEGADVEVEANSATTDEQPAAALDEQLAAALEEAAKFKDVALRAEAEMENVRRRATRDVEHAHKFGIEKLVQNLLPVMDSLEKGYESAEKAGTDDAASKAVVEGVGLCLKMLADVLQKEGLTPVDPAGEPFDPNLHQAMSMVENPDMEPNSVVAVIQKGYTLNDRLVRPAMVMVSKAPAEKPESGAGIDETV